MSERGLRCGAVYHPLYKIKHTNRHIHRHSATQTRTDKHTHTDTNTDTHAILASKGSNMCCEEYPAIFFAALNVFVIVG